MIKKTLQKIAFVCALVVPLPLLCQQTGSVSGTVTTEDGVPIPSGTVVYASVQKFARDRYGHLTPLGPLVNNSLKTGSDGSFLVAGLPTGDYNVCGFGTKTNQLGSCEWGKGPARVHVDAGKSANATLTVRSGVAVTVRVQNLSGSIAGGAKFLMGIITDSGYYRRAERVSSDPTNVYYTVRAPKGIAVRFFIDSDLKVTNASGNTLEVRRPTTEQILTGSQDSLSVTLTAN